MCSAGTGWSLGMFFCCPFHTRLTNRYAPILINTSVHTGRVMPCILLTLYTHEHNPKHIFTLEVYFLSFNACNYSDCVLGAKGCQSAGGLHSVLWLNASLWTLMENWSCCCCSANLLLKLLLLCRHSVNLLQQDSYPFPLLIQLCTCFCMYCCYYCSYSVYLYAVQQNSFCHGVNSDRGHGEHFGGRVRVVAVAQCVMCCVEQPQPTVCLSVLNISDFVAGCIILIGYDELQFFNLHTQMIRYHCAQLLFTYSLGCQFNAV